MISRLKVEVKVVGGEARISKVLKQRMIAVNRRLKVRLMCE